MKGGVERTEQSRAEPACTGCKQGVRGALLEAAGLLLPAVPCRALSSWPPYYSLLQQNSSRLPGGEAGDQLVTGLHVHHRDSRRGEGELPDSATPRSGPLRSAAPVKMTAILKKGFGDGRTNLLQDSGAALQ